MLYLIFVGIILSFLLIFQRIVAVHPVNIYGTWKGIHNGRELILDFNKDKSCVLFFKDSAGSISDKLEGNFEIDFLKNPCIL